MTGIGYSVYCAACAGPLKAGPWPRGSSHPAALERRRRHIQRGLHFTRTGEVIDSSEEDNEEGVENGDGGGSSNSVEEEWERYDPTIVDHDPSGSWTGDLVALGFGPDADKFNGPKVYRGVLYEDLHTIILPDTTNEAQLDPNRLGDLYRYESGAGFLFPLHTACYEIICRAFTRVDTPNKLDPGALWDAMRRVCGEMTPQLFLDYGPIHGNGHDWQCVPGEEFSIMCPLGHEYPHTLDFKHDAAVLARLVKERVKTDILESRDATVQWNLENRQMTDPFEFIPEHLLQLLIEYLPPESFFNLRQASWCVLSVTRRPSFWKLYMKRQMTWFWELDAIIELIEPDVTDWKSFYLWIDRETVPKIGMGNEALSLQLANRRRIWSVAAQLEPHYRSSLVFQPCKEPDSELVASSSCSYTSLVPLQVAEEGSHDIFLFRSRDEIHEQPCFIQTWMSHDFGRETVVGIGTDFKGSRRFWGADGEDDPNWHCNTDIIEAGSWVVGLYLFIDERTDQHFQPAVVGVKIILQGEEGYIFRRHLGDTKAETSGRWIDARPGYAVIGIHVGSKDPLVKHSRFTGLIEVPRDPNRAENLEERRPLEATLLWSARGSTQIGSNSSPLWSRKGKRNRKTFHLLGKADHPESALWNDLTPHDVVFWTRSKLQVNDLETISFLVRKSHEGERHIVGASVVFARRQWKWKRYAGIVKDEDWSEDETMSLDVDSRGGERIVECGVDSATDPHAFMLRTNWDRVLTVGDAKTEQWVTKRPPDGEHVVGLAFATFTWSKDTYVYYKLHTMIMVTGLLD